MQCWDIIWYLQLPNEVNQGLQAYQERKAKLDEHVRTLTMIFKKLRFIYDKVNENTAPLQQKAVEVIELYFIHFRYVFLKSRLGACIYYLEISLWQYVYAG